MLKYIWPQPLQICLILLINYPIILTFRISLLCLSTPCIWHDQGLVAVHQQNAFLLSNYRRRIVI